MEGSKPIPGNAPANQGHCETAANYRRVIVSHGRYRVAICRDGVQWLFQKCTREKPCARARWKTVGYFVTREALRALQHRSTGANWPELVALPPEINRGMDRETKE